MKPASKGTVNLTRILIFLGISCVLVFGMHYYVWARLVRDPQLPDPWARAVTAALVALAISLPLSLMVSRLFPGATVRPLLWLVYIWMGVSFLFLATLSAVDLVRLLGWAGQKLLGPDGPSDPRKRLFLTRSVAAGVGGAVAALTAVGLKSALGETQVKELVIKLRNLPSALAGLRLVQISDVHVGPLLRKDWVTRLVAEVQALKPDLIVITGDLVDGSVDELREHVAPLSGLKAPHGVFFVTGNHEYYSGVSAWLSHLPTLGIRPLANERLEVAPGLDLAGINDLTAHGSDAPDLTRALEGRNPQRPVVLLAHQPRQFLEAAEKGVDLTLSGHTHGGQIWPFAWLVALAQPYVAGLHQRGASQLYVSRGTGFWGPPMRILAPAEITLLKLVPAQAT